MKGNNSIDSFQNELKASNQIFQDEHVFDFDYVSEVFCHQEKELPILSQLAQEDHRNFIRVLDIRKSIFSIKKIALSET